MMVTLERLIQELQGATREYGAEAYVVGGWVRDRLLGRPIDRWNLDVAVSRNTFAIARRCAERWRGHYVELHEQWRIARVVIPHPATPWEVDFAEFRGPTIAADLARRDFTINAMALPLEAVLRQPWEASALIDPLNGQADLAARRLCLAFPGTFADDPLRLLRAFRFSATHGLTIAPEAAAAMAGSLQALPAVAGERITEELWRLLEVPCAAQLQAMAAAGVLEAVLPELHPCRGVTQGGYHHLDVFDHCLETVVQLEGLFAEPAPFGEAANQPLRDYLATPLAAARPRLALIKLGALLHDIGKPPCRWVDAEGKVWFTGHEARGAELAHVIGERLRLSVHETESLATLISFHLRPGYLVKEPVRTRRAIHRFFRDTGEDGPAILVGWMADRLASRGPASDTAEPARHRPVIGELLEAYFCRPQEAVAPPRLLSGTDVMEAISIPSGPLVGELLEAVCAAQLDGRVATRHEALALVTRLYGAYGRRAPRRQDAPRDASID